MATGPLAGVKVLDLSVVGPGARCGRVLADYGADVVKVSAPGRQSIADLAFHAYSAHRGMRQVQVDLRSPAGREAFLRLAAGARVVIESFRPGVVDRLGVGYEAVRAVNPAIVYCSTSGYGQTGPAAQRAGHDLNYLAVGGYLATSGRTPGAPAPGAPTDQGDADDRDDDAAPPALPGATVADIAAGGMHAAIAILAALVAGEGAHLDVAVADGVAWMMSLYLDEHLATGEPVGPGHNILTGRYACYGVYTARDGKHLAVGAIEPAFWANLCRLVGREDLIPLQHDDDRQDEVRAALAEAFATRDRDEWAALLADADTCVAPVLEVAEVVADPQFVARGAVVEAKHPVHGTFRQLGPVLAGAVATAEVPDTSTTDTDAVLAEAGFAAEEIAALREQGAVA
ncbi:MAG TPA: CaiB/BaiF CoA-transferase family protein [Acidimicrobiales bacterium]